MVNRKGNVVVEGKGRIWAEKKKKKEEEEDFRSKIFFPIEQFTP